MRIEGIFQLTSPLHCSSGQEKTPEGHNIRTGTVTHSILTPNGEKEIPYFPGNDLKGRLRRKAARMVIEQIVTPTRKMSVGFYVGLNSGTGIGGIAGSNPTVDEIQRARTHVYMGLLGGGCRMLRARIRVNDLVPVLAETVAAGLVPASYAETNGEGFLPRWSKPVTAEDGQKTREERATDGWHLTKTYRSYCVDDAVRMSRPREILECVDDPAVTVTQHQLEQQTLKNKVASIYDIEAIQPGTPMYLRIDFAPDATDAHVGLAILALRELVREQALGGKVSAGWGRFQAKGVTLLNGGGAALHIFSEDAATENAELHPDVSSYVAAAQEGLARCTYEDTLTYFVKPPQKPKDTAAAEVEVEVESKPRKRGRPAKGG